MRYFGSHRCGASIVSNTWAVSAAHCTVNIIVSQTQFRAGSSVHASGGQLIQVLTITNHPQYSASTIDFDLNVMSFAPIVFGTGIQPIPLPTQGQETAAGALANISGWGALTEGGGSPAVLQVINVPVVSNAQCNTLYGGGITANMICAGLVETGGQDACQGDSGGPMVVGGQLIGATSWGRGCARPQLPGVYARVAAMRTWVASTTGV